MDDSKHRRALLVLLVVLMMLPSVAAWMYFIALAGSAWVQWIYGGSKVVQFGMPLVWVWWTERRLPRPDRPKWGDVRLGLVWGAALVALGLAAYFGYFRGSPFLASTPELIRAKLVDMGIESPALFFGFA